MKFLTITVIVFTFYLVTILTIATKRVLCKKKISGIPPEKVRTAETVIAVLKTVKKGGNDEQESTRFIR